MVYTLNVFRVDLILKTKNSSNDRFGSFSAAYHEFLSVSFLELGVKAWSYSTIILRPCSADCSPIHIDFVLK